MSFYGFATPPISLYFSVYFALVLSLSLYVLFGPALLQPPVLTQDTASGQGTMPWAGGLANTWAKAHRYHRPLCLLKTLPWRQGTMPWTGGLPLASTWAQGQNNHRLLCCLRTPLWRQGAMLWAGGLANTWAKGRDIPQTSVLPQVTPSGTGKLANT